MLKTLRLLNGKELSAKDGVKIEKDVNTNTYVLTIAKLNPAVHAGKITIKATNLVGSIQHDIDVDVYGKFFNISFFVRLCLQHLSYLLFKMCL